MIRDSNLTNIIVCENVDTLLFLIVETNGLVFMTRNKIQSVRTCVLSYSQVENIFIKEFFIWEQSSDAYTCKIGTPNKGSKFGGMKSFVTYPLTPSFSGIQVSVVIRARND